jgi:hypothetical protein
MEEMLQSSLLHHKAQFLLQHYNIIQHYHKSTPDYLASESNDSHAKLLKKVQLNPQQAETINSII